MIIVSTIKQCVILFKESAHFTDIMIPGIILSWISSLLFNALVFGMTFARTFRLALSSRRYGSPDSLTNMLLRDGKKLCNLLRDVVRSSFSYVRYCILFVGCFHDTLAALHLTSLVTISVIFLPEFLQVIISIVCCIYSLIDCENLMIL